MNDEKLAALNEMSEKINRINKRLDYWKRLKSECRGSTSIKIYLGGDNYALVQDGFSDKECDKKNGFNYLPFTPLQLLEIAMVSASNELKKLQDEFDSL